MSASSNDQQARCDDLLIQDVVYGLSASEQTEMDQLVRELDISNNDRFDFTVGAIDQGWNSSEDLPAEFSQQLRSRIIQQASSHVGAAESSFTSSAVATDQHSSDVTDSRVRPTVQTQASSTGWTSREKWFGLITAASLLFGLASALGWLPNRQQTVEDVVAELSLQEQLDQFRSAAPSDLRQVTWTANEDPSATNASGEVLWRDQRQTGFMVFRDLQVNDPTVQQYQLWIVDAQRSSERPVDGGVFDITGGQVIVPIDAKIKVSQAEMFAITIEKPGGVVVSERERLPLLAQVSLSP